MHISSLAVNKFNGVAMRLHNKIAVITGDARGIGRAIAEKYVEEGARVVIADLLLEEAKQAAKEIGNDTLAVSVDVSKRDSIAAMARLVTDRIGAATSN